MKRNIILLATLLVIYGCSNSKSEKCKNVNHGIGKYVYIDSRGVLHSKKCYTGTIITNENGQSYTLPVQFLDTTNISSLHLKKLCSRCIEDAHFEILQRIAARNKENIDF
jgi:hypothetical protein